MCHRLLAILIVLLSLTWPASPAQAGGVVSICDEVHLKAALAGGGAVTFACSGTILLTSTIIIDIHTWIDGSGQAVTISGDNKVQVFFVNPANILGLIKLTVANGNSIEGGGIYNSGGTVTVSDSTFYGNNATRGGGIYNLFGTVIIGNSTFSGNNATKGGGIFNVWGNWDQSGGNVTVINSTFSGNTAGEGSAFVNNGSYIRQANTIVANSSGENCQGTITDYGGNLVFGDDTCPGTNSNPMLGPLQDNGGPTYTMALSPGSPAIDAAIASYCAASPVNDLDQRGVTRPVDGDANGDPICDIGAFEYRPFRPIYLPLIEGP